MSAPIDHEKIKKAAKLSADREFKAPEAGDEDRRYTGPEIVWLDFVNLATPTAVLALFAEIDRLKAELECAVGDIRTATQIIERNQKDADRYRWLRSPAVGPHIISTHLFETVSDDVNPPYRTMKIDKELDEAIDRRIQEQQK